MTNPKSTVHRLMLSDHAFDLIVEAIAKLSRKERKFAKVRDVVLAALQMGRPANTVGVEPFVEISTFDGPNQVFLRLDSESSDALVTLKEELNSSLDRSFGIRETVCFCAFLILKA